VFGLQSLWMHTAIALPALVKLPFGRGEEVLRVTARKDQYSEVEEFICNTCRFDTKEAKDWTIEGPRHIERSSVISANHYELPVLNVPIVPNLPSSTKKKLPQH
jgi:NADH-quinone oxidoreductase subunit G